VAAEVIVRTSVRTENFIQLFQPNVTSLSHERDNLMLRQRRKKIGQ